LPEQTARLSNDAAKSALLTMLGALKGRRNADVSTGYLLGQLGITLLPMLLFVVVAIFSYRVSTAPIVDENPVPAGMQVMGEASAESSSEGGLAAPPGSEEATPAGGLSEPPGAEPVASGLSLPPGAEPTPAGDAAQTETSAASGVAEPPGVSAAVDPASLERQPASATYWVGVGVGSLALFAFYALFSLARLEVFKMLLSSFFPLVVLILAVLGSIVFGLATPTEAAAVGAFGGALLAAAYGRLNAEVIKESVFLTAKTSAMVCWLFVGSAIFSAAFALLGGQELVERWVMSMNLTKIEFLILSQVIIFLLGWPLEWTEIIVIFMPIFIPLLDNFGVDPLFFGLLVALNLQTAFLSPPVAMAAFYLKGVSPPHVTLNQIFAGMLPFMGIQVLAIVLLYVFPEIGLWLPQVLYK
jgi:TRAP-type mannitol/chloroaromatic compound transport system permease large subunit